MHSVYLAMSNDADTRFRRTPKYGRRGRSPLPRLLLIDVRRHRHRHAPRLLLRRARRCGRATEEKKKDEARRKRNRRYRRSRSTPIVLPSEPKVPLPPVKPGHWATASQEMTANYHDFVGDSRLSVVDSQNRPYPVASTPFYVRASRPVLLDQGPPQVDANNVLHSAVRPNVRIALDLEERGLGSGPAAGASRRSSPMPSYQYNFVVLAKSPSRYSYIKSIDSVKVAIQRRVRRRRHRRSASLPRRRIGRRPAHVAPR